MPTLMLRGLPATLVARLGSYADRKGLGQQDAAVALIDAGLRAHERAVAAGQARGAALTPEHGRAAVQARWTRQRQQDAAE